MIYALWYYFKDGEKTTNAVSLNPQSLLKLHEEIILNNNNLYHQYKKYISNIEVETIDCYHYNEEFQRLEPIQDYNKLSNGLFYASQYLSAVNSLTDILVYLTKDQHKKWKQFTNESSISHNEVKMNEYYEDGIMNA
jgi:hypothetical protein